MKSPRAVVGGVAICVAAAFWGLDGVVLTPRLTGLPVIFAVFLVHALPFLLMQPFLYRSYGELFRASAKTKIALSAVSLTGGLIGTIAIVKALFLVDFDMLSVVVVLQKLQPVFAISLAAVLLKEKLTGGFVFRAGAALSGAYLLTFGFGGPTFSAGDALGQAALLSLLAAACFGAATVLGKLLITSVSVSAATFGRYGITSGLALLWALASGSGLPLASVTDEQWLIVFAIGLTSGTGAIVLYYWGLKRVRASVSTICELCLPLSAVILDYFVNQSVLRASQWLGAAVLLAAIFSITIGQNGQAAQRKD